MVTCGARRRIGAHLHVEPDLLVPVEGPDLDRRAIRRCAQADRALEQPQAGYFGRVGYSGKEGKDCKSGDEEGTHHVYTSGTGYPVQSLIGRELKITLLIED